MFSFVLMKVLESSPKRYDFGINLISLGRAQQIKQHIVDNYIQAEDRILDIGCGTATLSIMMAEKGAYVEGFDPAARMLSIAREKTALAGLIDRINLVQMGVAQMDTNYEDERFDKIVSTLVFSELSNDEQKYVVRQCYRILKKNGLLIIADEVLPDSILKRILYFAMKIPLAVATFLLAQATTRSVKGLAGKLDGTGFNIISRRKQFNDAFETIIAQKGEDENK